MTRYRWTATRLLVACSMLAASSAQAQTQKIRPGLWEQGVTMKSQSGQMESAMAQMQQSLASMPPEQRKMMEQMMAQQGLGMGPKGNTVRICISQEQAELDRLPQEPGCTQTVQRTGPNTLKVAFSCKGSKDNPPSSGEGSMTLRSPTAYEGQFRIKTMANGKPEQLDMQQSGKWLSADCGAIKPVR
ncbi:MAG: DUF3617 domain-containing protein [Pseudomonadota bacterium]